MRIVTLCPGLNGKAESFAMADGIVKYKVFAFLCGISVVLARNGIYIIITVKFKYFCYNNNYSN
jgi:hypothetical protein